MVKMDTIKKGRGGAFLLFFFFILSVVTFAGDGFKLQLFPYVDTIYTNNVYWDSTQVSDRIISPGVEVDYSSSNLNFYFDATGRFYTENNFLNSYFLSSGFEFYKALGGRDLLYITPNISINTFNSELSYLDNMEEGLTIGLKKYLTKSFLIKTGIKGINKDYSSYDSYDHFKFSSFLQLNKFFKTQITLRGTVGFNYLYFPHIIETQQYIQVFPIGRRGRNGTEMITEESSYTLSLPIFYSTLRLAQSVGTLTGLVLEYSYRKKLVEDKVIPDMSEDEWILTKMNDDFFWDGSRYSIALKSTKFFGLTTAVEFSYFSKLYEGIFIRDLVGEIIQPGEYRKDTMYQGTFSIMKSFGRLNVYLKGIYRDNSSNDDFFDYNLFTIMGGIDYNF